MRISKYRYANMVEELERLRDLVSPLPSWVLDETYSQKEADFLFELLIGCSWNTSAYYNLSRSIGEDRVRTICQSAWSVVSLIFNLHTEKYREANEGQMEWLKDPKTKRLRRQWFANVSDFKKMQLAIDELSQKMSENKIDESE